MTGASRHDGCEETTRLGLVVFYSLKMLFIIYSGWFILHYLRFII